jgi:hypothetical protein
VSHFTHIQTRIHDLSALQAACGELGLQLVQNAEARGYGSNRIRADWVIRLRGPYDVALQKQEDGSFRVTADLWAGHVERELGKDFGRLKQFYGVHKATLEARKKGLTVRRQQLANGAIRLALCRG